jgi:hypothetical protein
MRLVSALVIASVMLLAAAPAVLAGPKRADTFYTFMCIDPNGNLITAESVDAQAIEQGGKLMGSAHWELAHPDYDCWVEGPFSN